MLHYRYFSAKPGAYYSDSLFFLSIAIHRVMPDSIHKAIMLDADLRFRSDIRQLYDLFDEFIDDNIMGKLLYMSKLIESSRYHCSFIILTVFDLR